MVQSLFMPGLCLCPAVAIVMLMIWLLHTGREKGHVRYPALLITVYAVLN